MANEDRIISTLRRESLGDGIQELEALAGRKWKEPEGERRIRLLKQLGLVLIATLGHVSTGVTQPWPSPALSSLALNNASLVGTQIVLTNTQMDLTGSLMVAGFLVGSWMSGCLVTRWGRRLTLRASVAPYLLGWLLLALAPNPPVLLTARMIEGVACGIASVSASMCIMEISDTDVRGMMLAFTNVGIVMGGLYTVGLGYLLPWHYLSLACALPPLALLLGSVLLPYSPSYLLLRGKRVMAVEVLKQLRGPYADVAAEVSKLEDMNSGFSGGYRILLEPKTLKRVAVVVMLFTFQNFCGNYVFIIQTSRVLQAAGVAIDPDLGTVVVAVARLVGNLIAIFLVDRIGRRMCLIISHSINALTLVVLGVYVFMVEAAPPDDNTYVRLSWVPMLCVVVVTLVLSVGAHPVPFMLAVEYFPASVRGQATPVCYLFGTVFSVVVLQLYSYMQETLTQAGLYWFYASFSCLAVIYTLAFVQETKGKYAG